MYIVKVWVSIQIASDVRWIWNTMSYTKINYHHKSGKGRFICSITQYTKAMKRCTHLLHRTGAVNRTTTLNWTVEVRPNFECTQYCNQTTPDTGYLNLSTYILGSKEKTFLPVCRYSIARSTCVNILTNCREAHEDPLKKR